MSLGKKYGYRAGMDGNFEKLHRVVEDHKHKTKRERIVAVIKDIGKEFCKSFKRAMKEDVHCFHFKYSDINENYQDVVDFFNMINSNCE